MRRRFFIPAFTENRAIIEGETAHHLGRVLRAREGQLYELSDGHRVWLGRIDRATKDRIEFTLLEEVPAREPAVDVTLLLSIVKFEAFEWAIEKATELGVSTLVPVAAARSDKALLAAAGKRSERWKKILLEASQQSRRVRVPALQGVLRPEKAFRNASAELNIILSERSTAPPLRKALGGAVQPRQAALAIGPEGGWTDDEFQTAQAAGFREASLGELILRTETAVVATLAALNYAFSS